MYLSLISFACFIYYILSCTHTQGCALRKMFSRKNIFKDVTKDAIKIYDRLMPKVYKEENYIRTSYVQERKKRFKKFNFV